LDHAESEEDFSGLVIEDDDHEEGKRGEGEMREGNHTRAKSNVDPLEVAEEGDEGGLGEESAVHVDVDHALLGDGQVSGLADEEVGPLDAHDGDEVTALGIVQGLNSVADLIVADVRVLIEVRIAVVRCPSALAPVSRGPFVEEESHVNGTHLWSEHIKGFRFAITAYIGLILFTANFNSSVTLVRHRWVINVLIQGSPRLLLGETEECGRGKSIVIHDIEVCEEAGGGLDDTNLQVGKRDELGVDKMVSLGVTWEAIHDVELNVLVGEGDGWVHISSQVNAKNENGGEGLWDLEQHEEDEGGDLGDVG